MGLIQRTKAPKRECYDLHCTAGSSRSFTAIRKDAGLCCGPRLRKGKVFAYAGRNQNLKDLKVERSFGRSTSRPWISSRRVFNLNTIRTIRQRKLLHNAFTKLIVKPMCSNFHLLGRIQVEYYTGRDLMASLDPAP